jgi:hypothetical protein
MRREPVLGKVTLFVQQPVHFIPIGIGNTGKLLASIKHMLIKDTGEEFI